MTGYMNKFAEIDGLRGGISMVLAHRNRLSSSGRIFNTEITFMKLLIPFYLVGSMMLSPIAWAEGGSDRTLERLQQLRDKAEAV